MKLSFRRLNLALLSAAMCAGSVLAEDQKQPVPTPANQTSAPTPPGLIHARPANPKDDPNLKPKVTGDGVPGAPHPAAAPLEALPQGKGLLTFEETTHDFGKVYDTTPRKWSAKFKNTGTERLSITQVRPGCGCTAAQLSKNDYEPGEEGTIELTWNPTGVGEVTKPVTITSNDMNEPNKVINIKATMVPLVKLDPMFLQGGTIQAGTERAMRLQLLSRDAGFTIKSVDFENQQAMPWKEMPDESKSTDENYPGRKIIEFTVPKDAPVGSFMRSMNIKVVAKIEGEPEARENSYNVRCFANIVGDLLATPAFVTVAGAKPNAGFESSATVTSRTGKAFTIKSAEVADMNPSTVTGLTVKTEQLADNKGWKVTLTGNVGDYVGPFRGSIRLVTDVEREGPTLIPFSGMSMTVQPIAPANIPGAQPAVPANTSPVAKPNTPVSSPAPAPAPGNPKN